jgi:hypothetical protein
MPAEHAPEAMAEEPSAEIPDAVEVLDPVAEEVSTPTRDGAAELPVIDLEPSAEAPSRTRRRDPRQLAPGPAASEPAPTTPAPKTSGTRRLSVAAKQRFYENQKSGMDAQYMYYSSALGEVARLASAGLAQTASEAANFAVAAFNIDQPRDTATRELLGALYSIGNAGKGMPAMNAQQMADLANRAAQRGADAIQHGEAVGYHYGKVLAQPRRDQRAAANSPQGGHTL